MKKIELKSMKIANFKGIQNLEVEFGHKVSVTGQNGSGKSSLYGAYLWCLFQKNPIGGEVRNTDVQRLTADNEIIHNVDTIVELVFMVDEKEVRVKRVMKENWQVHRGQTEATLEGTTQQRFIDDIPLQEREFDAQLGNICPLEDWLALSSINVFLNLKTDERRARLQRIAGDISDLEIAKEFPHVLRALQEGRKIDDFRALNKSTWNVAQKKNDVIPEQITALEAVKVEDNSEQLKNEIAEFEAEKKKVNDELEAHTKNKPVAQANELTNELVKVNEELRVEIQRLQDEHSKQLLGLGNQLYELEKKGNAVKNEIETLRSKERSLTFDLDILRGKCNKACERVTAAQNRTFEYEDTTVCPTCGQTIPDEQIKDARAYAESVFIAERDKEIAEAQAEVDSLNEKGISQSNELNDITGSIQALEIELKELRSNYTAVNTKREGVRCDTSFVNTPKTKELDKKREELTELIKKSDNGEELKKAYDAKTTELMGKIAEVDSALTTKNRELAKIEHNAEIDKQIEALREDRKKYEQTIVICTETEAQIKAFKKAKVTIVEERVSAFFDIVHWKMFEPNISNDGEKEICQAIIDGVPYESQNLAMQFNAGVDIVNGLSTAMGISVPLFIDNKESVTDLRPSISQVITLAVDPTASKLTFE